MKEGVILSGTLQRSAFPRLIGSTNISFLLGGMPFLFSTSSDVLSAMSLFPSSCMFCALPMNKYSLLKQFGIHVYRFIAKLGEESKKFVPIDTWFVKKRERIESTTMRLGEDTLPILFDWLFNAAALDQSQELGGVSAFVVCDDMFFDAHVSVLRQIISSALISHVVISSARRDISVPIMRTLEMGGNFDLADLACATLKIGVLIERTLAMNDMGGIVDLVVLARAKLKIGVLIARTLATNGIIHLADFTCTKTMLEDASAALVACLLVANRLGEDVYTSNVRISTGELLFGEDVRVQNITTKHN